MDKLKSCFRVNKMALNLKLNSQDNVPKRYYSTRIELSYQKGKFYSNLKLSERDTEKTPGLTQKEWFQYLINKSPYPKPIFVEPSAPLIGSIWKT